MTGSTEKLQNPVAVRHRHLTSLLGEPKRKPDLVSQFGQLRSTVDYAIWELLAAGLVERDEEGYRVTIPGRTQ